MTKHWWAASPRWHIHFGWLALLALAVQLIIIYVGFGEAGILRRFLFPSSYVLLLAFVLLNRRKAGILLIGAGVLLNFLPIVANGGLMPVSPQTVESVGMEEEIAGLDLGDPIPQTKNVLLDEDDTYLYALSDRLTWRDLGPFPVFSIGDTVIVAGLALTFLEIAVPAVLMRKSRDRPSLT